MSCICQYYAPALNSRSQILPTADEETEENVVDITNASESDDTKIAVCASELASCRAENWLLKKKLHDYEITIENLEQLVATVVDKQHHILGEMFELRQKNQELDTECRLQREYHLVERNALLQQLQEAKTLIYRSTKMLYSRARQLTRPTTRRPTNPIPRRRCNIKCLQRSSRMRGKKTIAKATLKLILTAIMRMSLSPTAAHR
ncbi:uncharacterized protein LOC115621983 isoform X2 [Scaptodrosophila lebanonensis]|uniref:Uncharacterized protein LOC115621983 isoform X2 n=1 Tax=Drosophila lebanonensis TaxID=7225 RepID=A0A6J2T455_DROLE|nr:uncharacterized protein LOC115621983 isoform X2 [Scaptodrosophila lebanonensis]